MQAHEITSFIAVALAQSRLQGSAQPANGDYLKLKRGYIRNDQCNIDNWLKLVFTRCPYLTTDG